MPWIVILPVCLHELLPGTFLATTDRCQIFCDYLVIFVAFLAVFVVVCLYLCSNALADTVLRFADVQIV